MAPAYYFKSIKYIVAVSVICYNCMSILCETEKKVIESFHVRSDIRYRFATTQIVSVVRNKEEKAQEITFDVALPEEAFIVSFSMAIDGKHYDGEVKSKMNANEEYQSALNKGQSAGIVNQAPRHTNTFAVYVNIAAESSVNFTLIYQELLGRKNGLYENEVNVNPGQAVEDFLIEIFIQDKESLTFIKTPALRSDSLLSDDLEADNELTVIHRPTSQTAYIVYKPNQEQQGKTGISAKFVVQYDIEHSYEGEIVVVDGYFIHFFAPDLPPLPKDIIFVLDVSGSMTGTKIEQLKSSMKVILFDLQPIDRFNIIIFSYDVKKWKRKIVNAEFLTILEAWRFVNSLSTNGATNINNAILTAIDDLSIMTRNEGIGMIFFLTDGQPMIGETDGRVIVDNVRRHNKVQLSIFGLAFGHGADYELLKKISIQNFGFARKIYEASDAALQVTGLYNEISSVSIKDATISYLSNNIDTDTITESKFPIIFNGNEVVISGKLAADPKNFEIVIQGIQKSGEVNIILNNDDYNNFIIKDFKNPFFSIPTDFSRIVEKMWAFLTIKQLLKAKDRHSTDYVRLKEIERKILKMSLEYSFVTPLTAMLVRKPYEEKLSVSTLVTSDKLYHLPQKTAALHEHHAHLLGTFLNPSFSSGDIGDISPVHPSAIPKHPARKRKNKRSKISMVERKQKIKISSSENGVFTDNPLPVFTVISGNSSHCFVPKKLNFGTYRLLTLPTGTFMNLGVICNKKYCIKSKLKFSGNHVTINLVPKEVEGWDFSASQSFNINDTGDVLTISGEGMIIKVTWIRMGKSEFYNLEINLTPGQNYSGLVGDLLKPPAKQKRKSEKYVSPVCKYSQYSNIIKNNNAKKYIISP